MTDSSTPPTSRNNSRRALAAMGPIILGVVFCTFLLRGLLQEEQIVFEDLALGNGRAVYASVEGHPIHCKGVADCEDCVTGFHSRGFDSTVVWFGNSQLHSINEYEPGQENAPPILSRTLREWGVDLLAFSQPNANLQEHYVLFEYLRTKLPMRLLILPIVFDDFRETGLRSDIASALTDPTTLAALAETQIGQRIIENHRKMTDSNDELGGVRQTMQEHSEKFLNETLEEHVPIWGVRDQARGRLFVRLYFLRNSLLMLDPQSKRPLIKGRYLANLAALEALLQSAQAAKVPVLVYIVPFRRAAKHPYVKHEYATFKRQLAELVPKYGVLFADLESLVDEEYWNTMGSTNLRKEKVIDFMHFRSKGHALLAEAVGKLIEPQLKDSQQ